MDEDLKVGDERAIEALLLALAAQAGGNSNGQVLPEVLEELVDCHRSTVRKILGCTGHLIHYGGGAKKRLLTALFEQLLSTLRRVSEGGPEGLLPGDLVELLVDRPKDHLEAWTILRVYYVGGDGTLDVGPESLSDDYVIHTLPSQEVQRPR